jgi:hypothetical protein
MGIFLTVIRHGFPIITHSLIASSYLALGDWSQSAQSPPLTLLYSPLYLCPAGMGAVLAGPVSCGAVWPAGRLARFRRRRLRHRRRLAGLLPPVSGVNMVIYYPPHSSFISFTFRIQWCRALVRSGSGRTGAGPVAAWGTGARPVEAWGSRAGLGEAWAGPGRMQPPRYLCSVEVCRRHKYGAAAARRPPADWRRGGVSEAPMPATGPKRSFRITICPKKYSVNDEVLAGHTRPAQAASRFISLAHQTNTPRGRNVSP